MAGFQGEDNDIPVDDGTFTPTAAAPVLDHGFHSADRGAFKAFLDNGLNGLFQGGAADLNTAATQLFHDPLGFVSGNQVDDPKLADTMVHNYDTYKGNLASDQAAHPIVSDAGALAGGLAGLLGGGGIAENVATHAAPDAAPLLAGFVAKHPKIAARLVDIGSGAGGSGLYSFNDTAGDLSDRLGAGAGGAVAGGVGGAVLGPVARFAGKKAGALADKAGDLMSLFSEDDPVMAAKSPQMPAGAPSDPLAPDAPPVPSTAPDPVLGDDTVAGLADTAPAPDAVPAAADPDAPVPADPLAPAQADPGPIAAPADPATPAPLSADDPAMVPDTGPRLADTPGALGSLYPVADDQALPLTAGQMTMNPKTQRIEQRAIEAHNPKMLAALDAQQNAAFQAFGNVTPDGQPVNLQTLGAAEQGYGNAIGDAVRAKYNAYGPKISAAYDQAHALGDATLPAASVRDGLLDRMYQTLASERISRTNFPGAFDALDNLHSDLENIKAANQDVSSVRDLEDWKQKSFNQINTQNSSGGELTAGQKGRVKTMLNQDYEGYLDQAVQSDLLNGRTEAIAAARKARGLASERFKYYESDEGIQKLIDNPDMTGIEATNLALGPGKSIGRGKTASRADALLKAAGPDADKMLSLLQNGAKARVLKASLQPYGSEANPDRDLINFGAMRKAIGEMLNNKEFSGTVWNDDELAHWQKLYKSSRAIAGMQDNHLIKNSKTSAMMTEFAHEAATMATSPLLPASVTRRILGSVSDTFTGKNISKNLDQFVLKDIDQLNQPYLNYYTGHAYGAAVGNAIYGGTDQNGN